MSLDVSPSEVQLASPALANLAAPALTRRTLWVMAAACGATVANTFYNQPLLDEFGKYFHASSAAAGLVATAAQVGYGVGLFFLVPLGDLVERRRLVLLLTWIGAVLLLGMAASPTLGCLIVMQLFVCVAGVSAQVLIPLGIDLSPPERRGQTVGTLMAGLLAGILLARTVAGFIGDAFGWRVTFAMAAVVMVIQSLILTAELPHLPPSLRMGYARLMRSMMRLLAEQPALRTAAVVSGLSFAGFTAFWTTLSFLLADRFHQGPAAAGMFGVVGLAGAFGAPMTGRLSDRKGTAFAVTLSLLISAVAYLLMWKSVTIPGLIVGVLLMDLGVQSVQVAEQSLVMALDPSARSRLNTLYMVGRFTGGAAGSAIGALVWTRFGWNGVCAFCVMLVGVAGIVHLLGPSPKR